MITSHMSYQRPTTPWSHGGDDNGRAARRRSSISGSPQSCVQLDHDPSLRKQFTARRRSISDSVPTLPVRRPDTLEFSRSVRSEGDRWSSGSKVGRASSHAKGVDGPKSMKSHPQATLEGGRSNDRSDRHSCSFVNSERTGIFKGGEDRWSSSPSSSASRSSRRSPSPAGSDAVDYGYETFDDPPLHRSSSSILYCPAAPAGPPRNQPQRRRISITSTPDGTTTVSVEGPPQLSGTRSHRRMSLTQGDNDTQILTIEDADDPEHSSSSSSSVSIMSDIDSRSRGSHNSSPQTRRGEAAAGSSAIPTVRQPRRWSLSLSVPRSSKLTVEFTEPDE